MLLIVFTIYLCCIDVIDCIHDLSLYRIDIIDCIYDLSLLYRYY